MINVEHYTSIQKAANATVCTGPPTHMVYTREKLEFSAVYCWKCKRRTVHRAAWIETVEPSYYDPNPVMECESCGKTK